jgi:hypothetical protein
VHPKGCASLYFFIARDASRHCRACQTPKGVDARPSTYSGQSEASRTPTALSGAGLMGRRSPFPDTPHRRCASGRYSRSAPLRPNRPNTASPGAPSAPIGTACQRMPPPYSRGSPRAEDHTPSPARGLPPCGRSTSSGGAVCVSPIKRASSGTLGDSEHNAVRPWHGCSLSLLCVFLYVLLFYVSMSRSLPRCDPVEWLFFFDSRRDSPKSEPGACRLKRR